MQKIDTLLKLLEDKVPFALNRFNDGEMMGIMRPGVTVARGDQKVDESLSVALYQAIRHRQENYWIGLPCSKCFPELFNIADQLVERSYAHRTHAVVFTNRNWSKAVKELNRILNTREVTWVSGKDQQVDNLEFDVTSTVKLNIQDAWAGGQCINDLVHTFAKDSVVMLSCGPTSRVLTHQWFQSRPDITFIDIGSTFDPFTRDVWHKCHKGTLEPCEECN